MDTEALLGAAMPAMMADICANWLRSVRAFLTRELPNEVTRLTTHNPNVTYGCTLYSGVPNAAHANAARVLGPRGRGMGGSGLQHNYLTWAAEGDSNILARRGFVKYNWSGAARIVKLPRNRCIVTLL